MGKLEIGGLTEAQETQLATSSKVKARARKGYCFLSSALSSATRKQHPTSFAPVGAVRSVGSEVSFDWP